MSNTAPLLQRGEGLLVGYGNFVFRHRNRLFPAVMVGLFLAFPPGRFMDSAAADAWLNGAGLAIALLGQTWRVMIVGLAYIKRGGVDKKVHADTLVTDGIFRHCRNPLYVGNIIVLFGLFVIYNNPWIYLFGGAFFLISYKAIVAAEEGFLKAKFGAAYEDYMQRVNRWLPSLGGLSKTFASMRFNWRRVLIKEYSSWTSWMVAVCGLIAYKAVYWSGFAAARPTLIAAGLGIVVILLQAVILRHLKKSKRLQE
jgi:protein-S-isoprenylcysteine O-methyltransferase Ste14